MLWSSEELEEITGGRSTKPFTVNGVSIDTRTLQPNDLFVALTVKRDGHDFVLEALEKGAGVILVSKIPEGVSLECPLILVGEVKQALDLIGSGGRARSHAKIVAVTGSVGKTSTKEMLKESLLGQCKVYVSERSYNNHWGVPLSLANMPVNTEIAVFEIGMNSPGEILPLARMIKPHIAIITAVTTAHLESFCSVKEIAKEKVSILEGLEENGLGVVNSDFEILDEALSLYSSSKLITFGKSIEADWRLSDIKFSDTNMICSVTSNINNFDFKINTLGEHHAINAVATLCAIHTMGADLSGAILALKNWKPFKGRGERSLIKWKLYAEQSDLELIDESYNASPHTMKITVDYFSNIKLNNLKIFPINIGQEDAFKSESFFKELDILNLEIYFDAPITLAKKFALRGVPTTIIFNKEGKEFARIIGSIDFNDEEFINWLKNYN